MKKILSSLPIIAIAGLVFFTGCKKAADVTPTAGKPQVTVTFDKSTYGTEKDFNVAATVSTKGDTAFITITADGSSSNPTGAIYINYQKDNNKTVKFQQQPNGQIIPSAGYKGTKADGSGTATAFNYAGSDFTFDIPNSLNTSWKLTIPIKLRSELTAKSDVFTIWVTKEGVKGRFDNPAQGLAYGVATVTLNYTNEALINYYETKLGNAANDSLGSLFSTTSGSSYKRPDANNASIGKSIDFVYNTPGDRTDNKFVFGSFYHTATATDADVTAGFGLVDQITNVTKIAPATTGSFDAVAGDADLTSKVNSFITSSTTTTSVLYPASGADGKEFAFITASGKKGIAKIVTATGSLVGAGSVGGQATLQIKVQR